MVSAGVTPVYEAGYDPRQATVAELVQRAGDGCQESWNALVDRYTNLLWSVARAHRLETSDAADVVQAAST